ncbi:hypothetical protein [Streptomyces orinoci]|uniref:Uncharacterized protein n=1 Tax=Streptomyces orinoci TaxID=67339 RepID=A0ABV3K602_STRON|nr:hypothetical protein [Streptomyces orinoci]
MSSGASGDGSQSTPFGKNFAKAAETLGNFKGRLDEILSNLEKSPASQKAMGDLKIDAATYGSLPSAAHVAEAYDKVHSRLTEMSKSLGMLIEGMGISAMIADRGYDHVDAKYAERLRAIQKQLKSDYRPPADTHQTPPGVGQGKHGAT